MTGVSQNWTDLSQYIEDTISVGIGESVMEFEALLLGAEPLVAFGAGLGALALGSAIVALGNSEAGQPLVESGRDLTKHGLKWSLETLDKVQETFAEAGESWNDLVAEAKSEIKDARAKSETTPPQEVEIK